MTTETEHEPNAINLETGEALMLNADALLEEYDRRTMHRAEVIDAQRKIANQAKRDATVERPHGYAYAYPKALAQISTLSGGNWRVMFFLLSKGIHPGGILHVRTTAFAAELGLYDKTQLQKHIRVLVDAKLIIRRSRGVYQLNPTMFWVGSSSTQVAAMLDLRANGIIE